MRPLLYTGIELPHRDLRTPGVGIRLGIAMWAAAASQSAVTVVLAATGDISTAKLFKKYGLRNVGYWTAGTEEYSNRLVYMLAFEDAGHSERAWTAGRAEVQHPVEAHRLLTGPVAGG